MAGTRKLTTQVQAFIVGQLACYCTPAEVVERVKEELGIEITRTTVQHYDPDQGEPAPKWRELHGKIRRKFIDDVSSIGIAHIGFRLRRLDRMAREAEKKRNYPLVNELQIAAAKEVGGAFTNKKDVRVGLTVDDMLMQLAEDDAGADDPPALGARGGSRKALGSGSKR